MQTKAIGLSLPLRLGQDGYFESTKDTISQVKANITNLFLTKPGERRFNNSFGSTLYKNLFDQEVELDDYIVTNIIQNDINKFMDNILVKDVKVQLAENQPNNSSNTIFISIIFTYKNIEETVDLELSAQI